LLPFYRASSNTLPEAATLKTNPQPRLEQQSSKTARTMTSSASMIYCSAPSTIGFIQVFYAQHKRTAVFLQIGN
jgi:hypothetical protein